MELTTEFIQELRKWQESGRRSIKITIDAPEMLIRKNEPVRIFAYDYDFEQGEVIQELSDLPTAEKFNEMKRAEAEATIAKLERELSNAKREVA